AWNRFFDRGRPTRFEDLRPADARALRNLVAATQRLWGNAPFVNKNVKHLLRVGALARVFPEAIFLAVERRPEDVAVSVLRARLASPDPARWFSLRPPGVVSSRAALEEQVALQVRGLAGWLDAELAALGPGRALRLDYEAFCRDPEAALAPLRLRLGAVGERN